MALPWLEAYGGGNDFFLFLHYWDPHTPYRMVDPKYVEKFYGGKDPYDPSNHSLDDLRSRGLMNSFVSGGSVPEAGQGLTDLEYPFAQYDAEIFTADEGLGKVVALCEKLKILDDTMILLTSDHGEALGEHGVYFDPMDAYEQVSHVPLVIWCPQKVGAGRSDALVQHIDLAPTILEAFGIGERGALEGRSLWPLLEGKQQEQYEAVMTNHGLWSAQRALRTKDWSLVRTLDPGMLEDRKVGWELFDRKNDPAESTDVAAENTDAFEEMKARYLSWLDEALGRGPDPLRIEAAAGTAAEAVKRRYREKIAADKARNLTPKDRADIDHAPKE